MTSKEVKFPKSIKKAWIKALRSGKYKQGKSRLFHNSTKKYCCLGVLARVCDIRTDSRLLIDNSDITTIDLKRYRLSEEKLKKFKAVHNYFKLNRPIQSRLMVMNDDENHNFNEIANYIDKRL